MTPLLTPRAEALMCIDAPHFCCGVVVNIKTRRVVRAAPIVRWMLGRPVDDAYRWCKRHGYGVT